MLKWAKSIRRILNKNNAEIVAQYINLAHIFILINYKNIQFGKSKHTVHSLIFLSVNYL